MLFSYYIVELSSSFSVSLVIGIQSIDFISYTYDPWNAQIDYLSFTVIRKGILFTTFIPKIAENT
jgi:hypothetical protein